MHPIPKSSRFKLKPISLLNRLFSTLLIALLLIGQPAAVVRVLAQEAPPAGQPGGTPPNGTAIGGAQPAELPAAPALPAVLGDKGDYAPGSTMLITGLGFQTNETVVLQVLHADGDRDNDTSPAHLAWQTTADTNGSFQASWIVPADQDELGSTLLLSAVGLSSGTTASFMFTDGTPSGTSPIPGSLYTMGWNAYGQLGTGDNADRTTPTPVVSLPGGRKVIAVTGGDQHSLVQANDGSLWAWGYGGYGEIGNGSFATTFVPLPVNALPGGRTAVSIAAGVIHNLVMANDGSIWGWGAGEYGQLGNGNSVSYANPVAVNTLPGGRTAVQIAAGGFHNLAMANDGSTWAWGFGFYGQLGNGGTGNAYVPVAVTPIPGGRIVAAIAAGAYHSLALATDGTIWAWGYGGYGQLGNGTIGNASAPVAVIPLPGGRVPIAVGAGTYHSLALASDGTVWVWGNGGYGQLGNGSTGNAYSPVAVTPLPGGRIVQAIATAGVHNYALATDGSIWAWGDGGYGQLGNGSTGMAVSPVPVNPLPAGKSILRIAGSTWGFGFILASDGNHAPVAANDNFTVNEDSPLSLAAPGVLGNDTDADSQPLTASVSIAPANAAAFALNADGSFTYTPNADFNGTDTFTYRSFDGTDYSLPATVTINVTPVNDAPVANAQSVTTPEDTAAAITLTGSDVDGNSLTFTVVGGPSHGSLNGTPPSLTYTPAANYYGPESFSFKVNDGTVDSAVTYVSIRITAVNDAPMAVNDSYNLGEDMILSLASAANGVLANDSDVDGDPLTAVLVSGPAHGTLTLNPDGRFTYTPAANFNGPDTFTYKANDGTADSGIATVTINVIPVNDAPVADAQAVTTAEDTALAVVLSGSDVDGNSLSYTVTAQPTHGTLSGATPNLTYTPATNYNGTDNFTFAVNDGTVDSAPATVSITVTPVNDAPIALQPLLLTGPSFGNPTELATGSNPEGVAIGDLDGDGKLDVVTANYQSGSVSIFRNVDSSGNLSAGSFASRLDVAAGPGATGVVLADVDGDGKLDIVVANLDVGTISILRNTSTSGSLTAESFDARVSFATGQSPYRIAAGDVDGDGRPDLAVSNFRGASVSVLRNTSTAGNIAFATRVDVPTIPGSQPDGVALQDVDGDGKSDLVVANGGKVSVYRNQSTPGLIDANSFAPRIDFLAGNGPRDVVVRDLDGDGKPDLAVANQSSGDISVLRNTSTKGIMDANSFAAEVRFPGNNNTIRLIARDLNADGKPDLAAVDGIGHLSVFRNTSTVGSTTASSFAPKTDFTTGSGPISLAAGDLDSDGRVDIVVVNRNASMLSFFQNVSVNVTTAEDEAVGITLMGEDAETLPSILSYTIVTSPTHGNLSGAGQNWTYAPAANYNGPDSFTFKVNDGSVDSAPATVSITVTPVNDAPADRDRTLYVYEDSGGGQSQPTVDVDGDPVSYFVVTPPAHGRVEIQGADHHLTYLPDANYNGPDSFTFKATDGTLESPLYIYSITVIPVNDAPVVTAQTVTTAEDTAAAITLAGSDVDGDALSFAVVSGPAHGTLSGTAPDLTYTPVANFNGPDSFTFKANDGTADSAVATVTINVIPVNDAPVADAQALTTAEDTALAVVLSGSDVDGNSLSYTVTTSPTHGTVSGTAPNLTYTPWPNYNGTDSFTFTANDGAADSAVATVDVNVTPVNDAPVVVGANLTTPEDTALPVLLSAADIEAGGYTVLQVFGSTTGAGRSPSGGLIEGADQRLYGTTEFGGAGDNGTVFRVNRDGSGYTVLHQFAANRSEGMWPRGRLTAGSGGMLYGTTASGGNSNGGTVWKLNADGTGFAVLQHQTAFPGSSTGLLLGSDGALYGTTVFGGASGNGTVFKVGTDSSGYALLHSFSGLANEGGRPYAQLVEDADGVLYGTTEVGGADAINGGTIFKLPKSGTGFTVLKGFTGGTGNAGTLRRGLLLASDGALYGVTPTGGQNSKGTVFKVQRDGTGFQLLHQFAANGAQGGTPQATLVEDTDGVLHGATTAFGALGGGTIFRLSKDGTGFGVLHHFRSGTADGNQAQGEPVVGSDGALYGVTFNGTVTESGELFKLARSATGLTYTLVGSPAHGTLSGTAPDLVYTPVANFNGPDSFTFTVNDGTVESAPATVAITVTPVNDVPVISSQHLSTPEDVALAVVLGATDVDGDVVSLSVISGPSHGSVSGQVPDLTYTPEANFHGSDYFSFLADDSKGGRVTATIYITVTPVNDAPVAVDDSYNLGEDMILSPITPAVGILANDTDVDGDALTAILVSGTSHGTLTLQPDGRFTYTPVANFNGPDSFTYKANDGTLDSGVATVTINVIPVNDAPVANAQSVTTPEDTTANVTLTGSDVDADALTFIVLTGPAHGTLSGSSPALTYAPAANYHGLDSFTFKVNDGLADSLAAAVSITVTPVNDGDPGDVDLGFATSSDGTIFSATPQVDGKILVGGGFTAVSGSARNNIARLNADGTPDASFNPNANGQVNSIAVQADGRILIGGGFSSVGGSMHNRMARLNADGTVDAGFNPDLNQMVLTTAVQPDGKIIIAGYFTSVSGSPRNYIARLNPDGTLDTGFNPNANGFVYGAAVLTDGRIVIGGNFTTVGGVARNYSARLNADGSVDASFNPNADGAIRSTVVQPDGKFLIGGNFFSVGGTAHSSLARLNADGTLDLGFNPSADAVVHSIALQADGSLVVGGAFTSVGGQPRNRLARINPDGTVDAAFNPDFGGFNPSVFTTSVQADGKVIVGGSFDTVGGTSRGRLVRLVNDVATQSLTVPSATRVEWLRSGTAPEAAAVAFDSSTDGGTTWTSLGAGIRMAGGWEMTGLNLMGSGQVRARARLTGGYFNGSSGLVEAETSFSFNTAPSVVNPIANQSATYGGAFNFTVPANTFSPADPGQTLNYTASGFPAWLSFDANSRTFSGRPTTLASSTVTVTAADSAAPGLNASTTFDVVVSKATLTVTADSFTRLFGEANPPLTGTLVGVVNGDNITASYTTTATPTDAAGVYTIYPVLNDPGNKLGNYNIALINGSLHVVNAQSQTITLDPIPAHTYGDAPFAIAATASSGLPVTLASSLPTVATVNGSTITIVGAGTTTITATQPGNGNYSAASAVTRTLTVAKAPLTISALNQTKFYGALPVLAAGYTGFVNGDTASSLSTPVTLATTATAGSVVGNYPITASGATAANYTITFLGGTLTVTPAILTVTADNKTKVYGAALPALTLSYSGFVNGDTTAKLTQVPTLSTTAKKASNAGGYPITATGGVAPNYQVVLVNGTLSVTPAPLTVTAANKSNVYGTVLPALTATYAGFVNGDGAASLDTPVVLNTVATIASSVGAYPILASGATDANYTIAFVPGTLTLTPRALTIRAQNKSKTYGAATPALTATYSGFVNGDTEANLDTPAILETTSTDNSPVGTYPINARGASDLNYTITFTSGTLTVSKATLTIKAQNVTKVYGAALLGLPVAYTGFVLGQNESVLTTAPTVTTTATSSSNAGNYPVTVNGATAANYAITFQNGTLTVSKAPLTITADNKSKVRGTANPAFTASYAGFVNGDTVASLDTPVAFSTTATTTSPVGSYPITPKTAKDVNYTVTFVNGTLAVTP